MEKKIKKEQLEKLQKISSVAKLDLRDMQVELKDKYGHVSIDVTNGSLTEIKEADEQADKKD